MEHGLSLLWALVLSTALAGLALWKRALTRWGLVLAWLLSLVICLGGGLGGFLALAATYLFTIAAGKLSRRVRERVETRIHAKRGSRDAVQVFCNVFLGALMLLLRAITGWEGFVWAYGGAMAASLADSMASELGVLSRRQPRDILTLRPVEPGMSGGVTLLGFGASVLGAAIIGGICGGFQASAGMVLDVTAAGTFAALGDSVLGSAAQVKYRCGVCGALTEKPRHCGAPGTAERGIPFVTNDTVNFMNNVLGALAALGLYLLHR